MRHSHLQKGAALIIFLTIMVLGISAILLSELNTNTDLKLDNQAQTTQVLTQAKEALIGYAAHYYDTVSTAGDSRKGWYGFLPCPDTDNNSAYPEGVEHGNCVGLDKSSLGRLPWRTLGLPPLRDGAGECLWYAISGPYKNATTDAVRTNMLNEDTNGLFEVLRSDGTTTPSTLVGETPQDRAVAVIIAPGQRLSSQSRHPEPDGNVEICGGNYTASNYLDLESTANINNANFSTDADTVNQFITTQDNESPINDQIVYITREELWSHVRKRTDFMENMQNLTRTVAQCLAEYANSSTDRRLPWAAPMSLTDYRDDATYDDQSALLSGRLPDIVNDSNSTHPKLMTECSLITADDELLKLWQNWKDHLFYAIADAHKPDASSSTPTCTTTNCLTVNGNLYAAIVMFANTPLPAGKQDNTQQTRDTPDKADITNYLEQTNATNTGGNGTYLQWDISDDDDETNDINDILYCLDGNNLSVTYCSSP
jgi:hypothetical protein